MIEFIDTHSVCGHLKAAWSGELADDVIQKAVGFLINLDPTVYEPVVKEIAIVFTQALLGNFSVPQEVIPHLRIVHNNHKYKDRYGITVSGNHFKDDFLNKMLESPSSIPRVQEIWAGMTNLKSACVINTLSRSEKDQQVKVLTHSVEIDPEFLSQWQNFVDGFTPYLIDKLGIVADREYTSLLDVPLTISKSTMSIDARSKMLSCKKGSPSGVDPIFQLRHPDIQRLCRVYPNESAAALFLGYEDPEQDIIILLPDVDSDLTLVGKIAIVPKRAEKPRIVYILLSCFDALARPLFHKLSEFEKKWNIQGVKSHDDARKYVRRRLFDNINRANPETFCSFDQTAFTDRFSYDLIQRPILVAMANCGIITQFDIDVVDTLNHGKWDAKSLGRKFEPIVIKTGSGMGTPPSFPLASIGNGFLLAFSYFQEFQEYPDPREHVDPPAKITGDDNVTFIHSVGQRYEENSIRIGLEINPTKSFKSKDTAEFCGKLITPDGIWDKRKLKDFPSPASLPNIIKYYGSNSHIFFREFPEVDQEEAARIIRILQDLPEPYGVREFKMFKKRFEDLDYVEQVVTLIKQVSDLKSIYPLDNKDLREDFKELARRKSRFPNISSTPHTVERKTGLQKKLTPFHLELVHNALTVWKDCKVLPWEKLVQGAALCNKVDTLLRYDDPDYVDHYRSERNTLVPKVALREEDPAKHLAELLELEPSIIEGGSSYEF